MKHSNLGASGAHRWLECPASVRMSVGLKDTAGFAAQEGTAYHALAEECLRQGAHPEKFLGETFEGFAVDDEMINGVGEYYDYVTDIIRNENADNVLIEQRLQYTDWVPGGYGTADCIVIAGDVAHVIDLKAGKGVSVYADDNPQGMLYALGVLQEWGWIHEITSITIHIVQPRIGNFSEWTIDTPTLLEFGEYAKSRALLTQEPNAPFGPSAKACQWCKASGSCEALATHNLEIIGADFDDLDDLPPTGQLSDERIAQIVTASSLISGWLKSVQEVALEKALLGSLPGYKAVAGRSIRQWADADAAEKFLRTTRKLKVADAYTKKLISPTQAEKILGKNDEKLQGLIVKPAGKPSLTLATDKRPALNNLNDFDDIA